MGVLKEKIHVNEFVYKIRCPHCHNLGAIHRGKKYVCICCEKTFEWTETAILDGIFLDKTPVMIRIPRYISWGCRQLNFTSNHAEQKALELFDKLRQQFRAHVGGRNSRALAASLIYISAVLVGERRTQMDVAKEMRTSITSIKNNYQIIAKLLNLDVEDW